MCADLRLRDEANELLAAAAALELEEACCVKPKPMGAGRAWEARTTHVVLRPDGFPLALFSLILQVDALHFSVDDDFLLCCLALTPTGYRYGRYMLY